MHGLADDIDVEVCALEETEDLAREELSEGLTLRDKEKREGQRQDVGTRRR